MIFSKEDLSKIFARDIEFDANGISVNSKEIEAGDIFVALHGEKTDGHNFIQDALNRGANLVISEKNVEIQDPRKLILCESSYEALVKIAKYNLQRSDAKNIAVTGSVGKTTTKNMIYHLLHSQFSQETYASKKNFNSKIGLPICAALMPPSTKFGIFEFGMSQRGDIKYLTEIVRPNVAIITNIYPVHLEFFESEFDIAKEKSEILEKSPEAAIIPADSPYKNFLEEKAKNCSVKNVISFGYSKNADVFIKKCEYKNDAQYIYAEIFGKEIEYKLNTINDAFVRNSVAAVAAAHFASGIDPQKIASHMESFSNAQNRSGITKNGCITIIDDTYNASPASVAAAIRTLSRLNGKRKIAVLGDMKELGVNEIHFHENLSATIDKYEIDLVFACGNLCKHLYDNLRECKKGFWAENSEELSHHVVEKINDEDCVLIKGSRSMQMEKIVDTLKQIS